MTRSEVYKVIDGERDYQDSLSPDRTVGVQHQVGSYLTMLRSYLAKAEQQWTNTAGDSAALSEIRKIAAIATRCMEDHGAPERLLPK